MRSSLLLLVPLLLGVGPTTAPTTPSTNPPTARPAHDRDPWIFRCVLDGNARMVVISLGHDVWAAYDANRCKLAKVWTGKVEFTGPVFDTRHGPQPKSDGTMLLDRPASLAPVTGNATTQPSEHDELQGYRGYRIKGDNATLLFDFDGVTVEETPTATVNEADKTVTFTREISVKAKSDQPITLETPTSAKVKSITAGDAEVKFDVDKNATVKIAPGQTIVVKTTAAIE